MEERIQSIEMELLNLKRDVGRVRESTSELNFKQSAAELALIRLTNALTEVREDLSNLKKLALQTSDSLVFLIKKHGELTDQVNRLEEELGLVKRSVFEHTILLKNLRRDVEELKSDVAELKSDVSQIKLDVVEIKSDIAELKSDMVQIKSDVADLKTGQTQILEAIQNLKN